VVAKKATTARRWKRTIRLGSKPDPRYGDCIGSFLAANKDTIKNTAEVIENNQQPHLPLNRSLMQSRLNRLQQELETVSIAEPLQNRQHVH